MCGEIHRLHWMAIMRTQTWQTCHTYLFRKNFKSFLCDIRRQRTWAVCEWLWWIHWYARRFDSIAIWAFGDRTKNASNLMIELPVFDQYFLMKLPNRIDSEINELNWAGERILTRRHPVLIGVRLFISQLSSHSHHEPNKTNILLCPDDSMPVPRAFCRIEYVKLVRLAYTVHSISITGAHHKV